MYFFAPFEPVSTNFPDVGKKVKVVFDTTCHMPPLNLAVAEILAISDKQCRIRILNVRTNYRIRGEIPRSAKKIFPDPGDLDTFVIPLDYLWAIES